MFVSRHRTTGQYHYIKVANKSFENVAELKFLGAMLTNQNCIHEEIKRSLNLRNTCYHAVQNFFVFLYAIKKCED
jgi:ribosomal protein S2